MEEITSRVTKRRMLKPWHLAVFVFTALLIAGYFALNIDKFKLEGLFFFSTMAIFGWMGIIIFVIIYEVLEEIQKSVTFNMEDHLIETKLLKEIISQQSKEISLIKDSINDHLGKKSKHEKKEKEKKYEKKEVSESKKDDSEDKGGGE